MAAHKGIFYPPNKPPQPLIWFYTYSKICMEKNSLQMICFYLSVPD